jgi:peptidoglycan/xylan/chitin deacetylase (PgdA/CDA1 family)
MRAVSLMYHDVVDGAGADASGFPGRGPARYKLERSLFEQHLRVLAPRNPTSVLAPRDARPLHLTFDDGGASAAAVGAWLRDASCVGHFFVTAGLLGSPGFLDEAGVAELAAMGHVVGTHSLSHRVPMTRLSDAELLEEWRRSVEILAEITQVEVAVASIPGGYVSERVLRAASAAGVRIVFTSEPTASCRTRAGCLVLGRYAMLADTPAATAAAIAGGSLAPRARQAVSWRGRQTAKWLLGDSYRSLRTALLERR